MNGASCNCKCCQKLDPLRETIGEFSVKLVAAKEENERLREALQKIVALNEMADERNKTVHTMMTLCYFCESQLIANKALSPKEKEKS